MASESRIIRKAEAVRLHPPVYNLKSCDMAAAGGTGSMGSNSGTAPGEREQDRYLPVANIARIMKKSLPEGAKIAKDAKDTV